MEVLQTSALPLGDGADGRPGARARARTHDTCDAQAKAWADVRDAHNAHVRTIGRASHPAAVEIDENCGHSKPRSVRLRASAQQPALALPGRKLTLRRSESERRLERETGFEPATSTLARSHSTTELF